MVYRGSIIEICPDSIVVLTEECTFERIKRSDGLKEGMEVYFEDRDIIKKSIFTANNISRVAAAVLMFIVIFSWSAVFWNKNYKAVALLSIDINPSVQIKVNTSYRVIKAAPLNKDASKLPLKNLKNYPLSDALEELVKMAEAQGYIKEGNTNYILVTSVELNDNGEKDTILEEIITEGKEKIETEWKDKGQELQVLTIESDKETLEKAKKEHISVGKMEVHENTKDEKKGKDVKDIKDKKVEEIIKDVEKIKESKIEKEKEDKEKKDKDNEDKDKKDKDVKKDKPEKEEKGKDKDNNKNKNNDKDKKNEKP